MVCLEDIWLLPPKKSNLKILHRNFCLFNKEVFRKLPVQKTDWVLAKSLTVLVRIGYDSIRDSGYVVAWYFHVYFILMQVINGFLLLHHKRNFEHV